MGLKEQVLVAAEQLVKDIMEQEERIIAIMSEIKQLISKENV